ncbi:hypothetical protein ABZ914_03740 [Spirillospora sp. NPDC046719]
MLAAVRNAARPSATRRSVQVPLDHVHESTDWSLSFSALSDMKDAQVTARCSVAHPRADALGNGVEHRRLARDYETLPT